MFAETYPVVNGLAVCTPTAYVLEPIAAGDASPRGLGRTSAPHAVRGTVPKGVCVHSSTAPGTPAAETTQLSATAARGQILQQAFSVSSL
eukprot:352470-Chlamydomonas_euryale.AAC.16